MVFELNGTTYTIIREGIKHKNGHVKVNVNFYTDTENLNGEERSETNKNIRKYLGTYDDFILTAFSLQADNNNFIEKSQRERKDLLSQFLDITVFEQLYQLAQEEIKETAGQIKAYKKTDFAETITSAEAVIKNNEKLIADTNKQESDKQTQRNQFQETIVELIETKQPTTYEGDDIQTLQDQETDLTEKIEELQETIQTTEDEISHFQRKINVIENTLKLKNYDIEDIKRRESQLTTAELELETLQQDKKKQKRIVDDKERKIKHLETHEYDPNCEYCVSNVFVQDAMQAKNEIEEDRKVLEQIQEDIDVKTMVTQVLPEYRNKLQDYEQANENIDTYNNKIEILELRLEIFANQRI